MTSVNERFKKNATLSFLSENESFEEYKRKRLSQSFEYSDEPKPKKRHVTDSFVNDYKDVVAQKISKWPVENILNWSEIAKQCDLPGTNAGQKNKGISY